ncbi:MAG: tetratricopeptide repeat protein [bacterium]|nr:tetratricopeptide repeat protein [bacterium]
MRYLLILIAAAVIFVSVVYAQNDSTRELGEHDARIEALNERIDDLQDNLYGQYSRFEVISGVMGIIITLIVVLMSIFQVINLSSVRQEAREARGEVRGEIDKIRDAADHIYQQRDRLTGDLERFGTDFRDMQALSEEVRRSHEEIEKLKADITELVRIFESRTREAEIIIANLRRKETTYDEPVLTEKMDMPTEAAKNGIGDFLSEWVSSDDENVRLIEAVQKGQEVPPERLLQASRELLNKGKLAIALKGCESVISREPENGEARLLLGEIHYASGDDDKAFVAFQKAVELAPDNATALVSLGKLYSKRGEYETAISCFERALEIDKSEGDALFNLGKELVLSDRAEEAEKRLTAAVESQPEKAEGHFFLGLACYGQEKYKESIGHFDSVLDINPDDSAALLNRAKSKAITKNVNGALEDLGKALRFAPYYRDEVEKDEAFSALRDDERYREIMEGESDGDDEETDLGIDVE